GVFGLPSSFSHSHVLEASPSAAAPLAHGPLASAATALDCTGDDLVCRRFGCGTFRDCQSLLCCLVSTATSSGQDGGRVLQGSRSHTGGGVAAAGGCGALSLTTSVSATLARRWLRAVGLRRFAFELSTQPRTGAAFLDPTKSPTRLAADHVRHRFRAFVAGAVVVLAYRRATGQRAKSPGPVVGNFAAVGID